MRKRVGPVGGAILAAALAASPAVGGRTVGSTAATSYRITFGASARQLTLGQRVRLRGELSRRGSGARVRGREIALQADPYPFGAWRTVARTRTGDGGLFVFSRRPRRNTRYRAVADTSPLTATAALTVYADLRAGIGASVQGERVTARVFVVVPSYARLPGRRVHFYHFDRSEPRGRLVGSARLERASGRRFTATLRYSVSNLSNDQYPAFCIRERTPDAWGRPRRVDRVCGRHRIRRF